MDRPRNPEDAQRAERTGATPIDSDDARTQARADESDDAIGTASYEMQRGEGGSSGDGSDDDTHAATPVGGESGSEDETQAVTPVGGGTIYAPATDDATEEPLDASGMQPSPSGGGTPPPGVPNFAEETGGSGANVRRDPGTDRRGEPIFEDDGSTSSGGSDDGGTATVREGVTRAIDPDEIFSVRSDGDLTADEPHARAESFDGFNPDGELARPPDLHESVDVTSMAPDGTTVPDGTFQPTDPLGQTIGGGRSVLDNVMSGTDALGGGTLDRGLDFDPTSPGTQDSGPGGQETTGDPTIDRAISAHDGSQYSAPRELKKATFIPRQEPKLESEKREPGGPELNKFDNLPTKATPEAPGVLDKLGDAWDWLTNKKEPEPASAEASMENPEGDGVETEINLERVRVMQGSQVQPTNNPDDPATGVSTENWIPPADLVTMPTQEGEATATTLTSAATLGSSPVVNPTDPVLGDDGIIHGSYAGGSTSGSGGGEVMPTSMAAGDASSMGGDALSGKHDVNGVTVDMVTGQVIGSVAPATGGELGAAGGAVSQGDEGDDDDGGVQSLTGAPSTAFVAAAPATAGLAAGGMVSQGDEGDGDEDGVQSMAGAPAAAAMADPAASLDIGDASLAADVSGPPDAGDPPMGEDGGPVGPPDSEG